MSDINFSAIQTTYPVAGQDNNSQGFRDNFSAISSALATAKSEITALQTNTVLVADLETGLIKQENNLQGSKLYNGTVNRLYQVAVDNGDVISTHDLSLAVSSFQVCTLTGDTSFTFTGWPENGQYAVLRVHLVSNGQGEWTPSFDTTNGGLVVFETSFPTSFTVPASGKQQVIEAWSYDNGSNVYVRFVGEF